MRLNTVVTALFGAVLLSPPVFAGGPGMHEGLWEITTTTEMPGMPFTPPPMTVKHCYTKEDVKEQKKIVPKQEKDCEMTEMKQSGNKFSWKVVCTGKHKSKGAGEILFKGSNAYEGTMKIESDRMKMTSRWKAKRVGECD